VRPAAVGVVREWVGKPLCPLCGSLPRLLLLGALGFDAFGGFVHGQATEFVGFGPSHGGPVSGVASLTVGAGGAHAELVAADPFRPVHPKRTVFELQTPSQT